MYQSQSEPIQHTVQTLLHMFDDYLLIRIDISKETSESLAHIVYVV